MTALYVPPTGETDPKKQNQSIQLIGGVVSTNTADIATINATLTTLGGSKITASLGADVTLNNTANYFDGPNIAQGTTGTWFVSGQVSVTDTTSGAFINAKLWDGTTVIASGASEVPAANGVAVISLSGVLATPAGNLRISVRDITNATGKIIFNGSGNSKDATISAFRIA